MKSRNLFICNSVYQIFVALWIKQTCVQEVPADIIISDHMNDGAKLRNQLLKEDVFEKVYYVESLDFAKFKKKVSKKERICLNIAPNYFIKRFVTLEKRYSGLYVANVDYFTQLIFDALVHRNRNIELIIFEDGMFTYSRLYEKDYQGTFVPVTNPIKKVLHSCIYRKRTIYGNVARMLLFNPQNILWNPPFIIQGLPKISCEERDYKELCNRVFGYYDNADSYDKKYIFMEESFSAEGCELDDVKVLNEFAKKVGKENIMVKIHPRNPVNRFANLGYKTNSNTSIPWEVVLMNLEDVEEKILITISSSSVLNPILIFGKKVRVYSIYECVDHENCNSRLLSGDMWEITQKLFSKYKDMVTVCQSVDEMC